MSLTIQTYDLEVEKPTGGGKGQKVLYTVELLLDGVLAVTLHRNHFKENGQMQAFVDAVKELQNRG